MASFINFWCVDNVAFILHTKISPDTKNNLELGIIHHRGLFGNTVDLKLAEEFYLKGINNETNETVSYSIYNLAFLYESQGNLDLAEKLYLKATEKGNFFAMNDLGNLYEKQDKSELAEKWYLKAVKREDCYAMNELLSFYREKEILEDRFCTLFKKYEEICNSLPKIGDSGFV